MTGNRALASEVFRLVIAIPVYNDWEVAALCLRQLDSECARTGLRPAVVIINDGSTMPVSEDFVDWRPQCFASFEIVDLYSNLGHQRAICVGLVHICRAFPGAAVLVMDADGEDPPAQVVSLVRIYLENEGQFVIFAARRRRMESLLFRLFYQIYRLMHICLVGFDICIGNFSIMPPPVAARLVRSGDLWNHYAASVVKSKIPFRTVPVDRAERLIGQSRMGFTGLVLHGLSAMSVYSDIIAVRTLMSAAVLLVIGLLTLIAVVAIRVFTPFAIPGWATNAFALTLILMLQITGLCLLFTFGTLALRSGPAFIPIRDCPFLVMTIRRFKV